MVGMEDRDTVLRNHSGDPSERQGKCMLAGYPRGRSRGFHPAPIMNRRTAWTAFPSRCNGARAINTKKRRMKNPYCSRNIRVEEAKGRKKNNTFEPSSGGTGIRLNAASQRLMTAIIVMSSSAANAEDPSDTAQNGAKRTARAKKTAMAILASGPAAPTIADPRSLLRTRRNAGL